MSCLNSLSILNPSRRFANDMPVYLRVPCGKCENCRDLMRNEWFFRSVIEFNHYNKIGGTAFMFTLTFNNENLPFYTLPSGETVKCFNKRYVHNFIKYFRILMKKNGYYHKDMKYLICSEYGDNGTHRPHHHGIMFFPYKLPVDVFLRHLRTAWHYGFVGRSELGFEVKNVEGLRYVMKYITKDVNAPSDLPSEYAPRHWQSIGYGESFINDVILNRENPADYLANNQYSLSFKDLSFPIPRYYHYKLERKVNKEISKVIGKVYTQLTDIGKEVKRLQFAQKVVYNISYLKTITPTTIDSLFPHYDAFFSGMSVLDRPQDFTSSEYETFRNKLIDRILYRLPKTDLHKLVLYRCFLRHYPIYEGIDPTFYFHDVESLYLHTLNTDFVPPEFVECGVCDTEKIAFPIRDDKNRAKVKTCSQHYLFKTYERLSLALDLMELCKNVCSVSSKVLRYRKIKRVKQLYNKYVTFESF